MAPGSLTSLALSTPHGRTFATATTLPPQPHRDATRRSSVGRTFTYFSCYFTQTASALLDRSPGCASVLGTTPATIPTLFTFCLPGQCRSQGSSHCCQPRPHFHCTATLRALSATLGTPGHGTASITHFHRSSGEEEEGIQEGGAGSLAVAPARAPHACASASAPPCSDTTGEGSAAPDPLSLRREMQLTEPNRNRVSSASFSGGRSRGDQRLGSVRPGAVGHAACCCDVAGRARRGKARGKARLAPGALSLWGSAWRGGAVARRRIGTARCCSLLLATARRTAWFG